MRSRLDINKKYFVLLGLFVASLTSSNYLAAKVAVLGSLGDVLLLVPAGVVAYAMTFTITDIIGEVYGKKAAETAVLIGFITQLLIPLYSFIAIAMPIAPFQQEYSEVFNKVFGIAPNIVIASLIAYIISQNHDVWAFHWWRNRTRGRYLWLRNNASTIVSQLIDTAIFITLAFGLIPSIVLGKPVAPWSLIPYLIAGQYVVKVLIALLDTPIVYLGVMAIRGELKTQLTQVLMKIQMFVLKIFRVRCNAWSIQSP